MAKAPAQKKPTAPDDAMLAEKLGEAKALWNSLLSQLDEEHAGLTREWKYYGEKYGWQLKVLAGKRAALYLVPHEKAFLAATALKGEALERIRASGLPAKLVEEVLAAKTVPEGKPARIEVSTRKDVENVRELVALKLGAR